MICLSGLLALPCFAQSYSQNLLFSNVPLSNVDFTLGTHIFEIPWFSWLYFWPILRLSILISNFSFYPCNSYPSFILSRKLLAFSSFCKMADLSPDSEISGLRRCLQLGALSEFFAASIPEKLISDSSTQVCIWAFFLFSSLLISSVFWDFGFQIAFCYMSTAPAVIQVRP